MKTFERARPGDAEAVFRLFEEAKRRGRGRGTTDWDETYPTRDLVDEDIARGDLWTLREGGALVAAISMLPKEELDGDAGWTEEHVCALARLCVDPLRQGQGIGAEMMRRITEEAARQGFRATRHLASVDNPAALRLYRRMGCRELGRLRLPYGDFIAFERRIGK
jgi:ribosomal protein S18 acetylase RimI-like enzyme